MKTITTTYHGPTNVRGSRYIADDGDRNRVILSADDALSSDANHQAAAFALCVKMKWAGTMVGGHTKTGMVWVWDDEHFAPRFSVRA